MKLKFLSLFLILCVVMGLATVSPVKAAGYGTPFLTSITYMNVGSAEAVISLDFYAENAASVTQSYAVANLAKGAAASLGIGAVFTSSFKGSAVISSDQPLVATLVQVPQGTTTVKNRPMSNGLGSGSTTVLIPTVLKAKFNTNSIFSVQNTGSSAANVTVDFIASTDGNNFTFPITNLAPGAAKYFDMGTFTSAGSVFNGSVRITSGQPVVATSMELSTSTDAVYAFEGISGGATTIYMPSALCKFSASGQTSSYAVQNTSSSTATDVTVKFTGTIGTTPVTKTYVIPGVAAGAKTSVNGCGVGSDLISNGFIGSATITATQPIVAIAKISATGSFVAAHNGVSSGATKLAAPYVRYSDKFFAYTNSPSVQQANIAVQNVGSATIPANTITVNFVGPDGAVQGTYTYASDLAVGAKFSVNPKAAGLPEFGFTLGSNGKPNSYGGGALIETSTAGAQLAAIVRVSTSTAGGLVAEDYNAMPVQ